MYTYIYVFPSASDVEEITSWHGGIYLPIQNEIRNRVIRTNKYPRTNIWNFKNIQYTYI